MLISSSEQQRRIYILLAVVLLINIIQAVFTVLGDDESYYWMYAQHPAFGYFDHPPMVAWMISAGTWITDTALGVRLFGVLSGTGALLLLWKTIDEHHRTSFFSVFLLAALSAPLLHFYGFIMTPDAPLIFFTAAFFFVWKQFLKKNSIAVSLLLGLVMAGLLYSKFHGVLIIVFSLLANLKQFRNPHYYLACGFGALLFLPHIWWQYTYDFPAIYYHFYWRATAFDINHIVKYIIELPLVQGPVLFLPVAVFIYRKRKTAFMQDPFLRSLIFCFFGIIAFFLVTSFRSRIEAHWTLLCALPALLLFPFVWNSVSQKTQKWLFGGFAVSVALLSLVRAVLIFDVIPVKTEFHRTDANVRELAAASENLPIVFLNSYKLPAKTGFYTRHEVIGINEINYRVNQYDLWMLDAAYHNRKVAVYDKRNRGGDAVKMIKTAAFGDEWFIHQIDSFETYQHIKIALPRVYEPQKAGGVLKIPVTVTNNYPYSVRFDRAEMPVHFEAIFLHFKTLKEVTSVNIPDLPRVILAGQTCNCTAEIVLPETEETYNLGVCIKAGIIGPLFNSNMTLVTTQQ
jgi:Dolichyl-phosphate-mannose-protein mannosyltransferase